MKNEVLRKRKAEEMEKEEASKDDKKEVKTGGVNADAFIIKEADSKVFSV